MLVCHVINTFNRGGAETHLLDLVKEQVQNNYDLNLVIILKDVYAQRISLGLLSLRRLVSEDSHWKVAWHQNCSYL